MSETATVRPHLLRWFDSQRVVFWHDPDGQYAADLDRLDLPRYLAALRSVLVQTLNDGKRISL